MRRLTPLLVAAAALVAPAAAHAQTPAQPCTGNPDQLHVADILVGGQPSHAEYVLPAGAPRGLVVMAHGYSHTVQSWREHMIKTARANGVIVVTPDYRGIRYEGTGPEGRPRSRGWPVTGGAEDLIAYANHFDVACPGLPSITLYSVSMGANISGYALTLNPRRADGRPLFDYWIATEGVHDFLQTYNNARLIEDSSDFARRAREDIEAEAGGTLEAKPEEYRRRTNVERVADIAASGIRGVVIYHGRFDGSAFYDRAEALVAGLRRLGVPVDVFEVGRRGSQESDTVAPNAPAGMAGHGSEISQTHIVIQGGLDRLAALLTRGEPTPCDRLFKINDAFTNITPNPAAKSRLCLPDKPPAAGADCPAASPRPGRIAGYAKRTLSGHASARGCSRIGYARVAVFAPKGRKCRFLKGSKLTAPRSCKKPVFRKATGRERWSLKVPKLPKGRYRAFVVAAGTAGEAVVFSAPGPTLKFRVR
jgi:acetyl esterase/lipase